MARTWYQRGDQSDSDCTPADGANKPLLDAQTGGNDTVTFEIPAQTMNAVVHSFTTASGDPGGAEDLGAGSLFRLGLDVTVIDASITITDVQFHGLNSSCTSQGSSTDSTAITTTGTHTRSVTWDPPVSDRYQVLLCLR